MTERDLFLAALERQAPADRAAFLEQECGDDHSLLERVQARLRCAEVPAGETRTLGTPPLDAAETPTRTGAPSTEAPANAALPLAFLAPPARPGSLGRLDHYEILEVIGQGGMGVVLRAIDEKLRRVVAVKVLAPQMAASPTARQRFAREARAAAAIRDPHVVAIFDVCDGPVPFLVMEYVPGQTLQERLRRDGALGLTAVLEIGLQTARGLAAAHACGLIHRDVKPGNILLENGTDRARLGDFGLARAADDASMTQTGAIAGTPLYMSPEQAEGREVDYRSDLFSLGSVLYAACTGRPPFPAPNTMAVLARVIEDEPRPIRQINPLAPRWLEKLIARLMAKDPDRRYPSAAAVAEILAVRLARLREGGGDRGPRARQFRRALVLAGLLAVIGGAVSLYCALRPGGEPAERRVLPALAANKPPRQASPLDGRAGTVLPATLRRLADWGDPVRPLPTLVALLNRRTPFTLPASRWTHWPAWSPDGRLLAVPRERALLLVDTRNGQTLRTLSWPVGSAFRPGFSPDGRRVAAGTGNDVRVWQVASGREELRLTGHTRPVWVAVFSPDGGQLATTGWDGQIKVWDAATGRELLTLTGHQDGVNHLAFSPDGGTLASAGHDQLARVWDARTGKVLATLRGHVGHVQHVAFRPDGKVLATAGAKVILWDTGSWKALRALSTPGSGLLAFTPDGRALLTAREWHSDAQERLLSRWEEATGFKRANLRLPKKKGWLGGALSPDGRTVCFVCAEGVPLDGKHRLAAYDVATGKELLLPDRHANLVGAVAVSADGKLLASGAEDGAVRLWRLEAWAHGEPPPGRVLRGHAGAVLAVAFSPDGAALASAGKDRKVILWDTAAGGRRRELADACAETAAPLAFSPDGQLLLIGKDGVLTRHHARTGDCLASFRVSKGGVRAMALSPDGQLLAIAGESTVEVLSARDGGPVRSFKLPAACARVAFTSDGKTLVAATERPHSRLCAWEVASGADSVARTGHAAPIGGLALRLGGGLAATASQDGTVRLWDLVNFRPAWGLDCRPFGGAVGGVAFTPEGGYLVIGHGNGCVSVLRMP